MTRPSSLPSCGGLVALALGLAAGLACGTGSSSSSGAGANDPALENLSTESSEDGLPSLPIRKTGQLSVACEFDDGWSAVLPIKLAGAKEKDEYLMQALIGLTDDPEFWAPMPEYEELKPHAASRCGQAPTVRDLQPGEYVLFIGWAGQFANTGYENNGRIEPFTIKAGQNRDRRFTTDDLDADLPCISCPFLLVERAGQFVELGQILIDRYIASKRGTDLRTAVVGVRGGRITVKLAEREPEVSHIDAIEVWYRGRRLPPSAGSPAAARTIDGVNHTLSTGQELTMHFQAPIQSGELSVEIRVNGYYILDRARP